MHADRECSLLICLTLREGEGEGERERGREGGRERERDRKKEEERANVDRETCSPSFVCSTIIWVGSLFLFLSHKSL